MATVTIEGRKVTVSDDFLKLSPEEQADEVDEIAERIGIRPASASGTPPGPWDERVAQRHRPEAPYTWEGAGKAIGGGLMQAAASVPGAIGDVPQLIDRGVSYAVGAMTGKSADQVRAEHMAARQMASEETGIPTLPEPWEVINSQKVLGWMEPVLGKPYEPRNTGEKYLQTITSFAPAAVAPGSVLQKSAQVAIPGAASEFAGQALEGTDFEGAGRLAAAIAGGAGTALASRKGVPERMVSQAMGSLDDATLTAAGRLMIDADRVGVPLTWPEAVQHASNGATRLTDLQRIVENSTGGGPIMRTFYADRPYQVRDAAKAEFDQIAPNPLPPESLGPRAQAGAQARIDEVNAAINNQTRPLYDASEQQLVPTQNSRTGATLPNAVILRNPAYLEAVRYIRNDPVLGPQFAHLPDNAVGMVDAAQKIMRSQAEGLKVPGQGMDPFKSSLIGQSRQEVTNAAKAASPEYDGAVQWQAQLRGQHLDPLTEGPTGKVAATSDVGAQTRAIFPDQPQARSEAGVAKAVRGIGRTDPEAAASIVRQHLETQFNEATQKIQSGQNPSGGARFASVISGNPQQRKNLVAALKQLPNGSTLWKGFSRFLDVLEATGKRPAQNSVTTFNAQLQKELEQGGLTGEAATIAASPQKALSYIRDRYAQFRLGKGTAQLARLFTAGNLDDFRRLINSGPGSPQAVAVAVRFLSQVNAAANHPGASAN
jgi:hypothetical protein